MSVRRVFESLGIVRLVKGVDKGELKKGHGGNACKNEEGRLGAVQLSSEAH